MNDNSTGKKTPIDCIRASLADGSLHMDDREDAFFGPSSWFALATVQVAADASVLSAGELPSITEAEFLASARNERLGHLAKLHLDKLHLDGRARIDLAELLQSLEFDDGVTSMQQKWPPDKPTRALHAQSVEIARSHGWANAESDAWSIPEWAMLGFLNDLHPPPAYPSVSSLATTPIFLANSSSGKVLRLFAQRLPGPAMIIPHWWRLGLAPLGADDCLLKSIHDGFRAVLNHSDHEFQIRWWLDTHPLGDRWHHDVTVGDSAQAAAACLALAFCEGDVLLDPFAGVSAALPEQPGIPIRSWKLDHVGFVEKKAQAAERAELNCFVLAKACTEENRDQWTEFTNNQLDVLPAITLGDAYEALLANSAELKAAKIFSSKKWFDERTNDDTDPECVAASENKEQRVDA